MGAGERGNRAVTGVENPALNSWSVGVGAAALKTYWEALTSGPPALLPCILPVPLNPGMWSVS